MFNPEDLEAIAKINLMADEITTRTDFEQPDDEGAENFEEYKSSKDDDEDEKEDKPMDS